MQVNLMGFNRCGKLMAFSEGVLSGAHRKNMLDIWLLTGTISSSLFREFRLSLESELTNSKNSFLICYTWDRDHKYTAGRSSEQQDKGRGSACRSTFKRVHVKWSLTKWKRWWRVCALVLKWYDGGGLPWLHHSLVFSWFVSQARGERDFFYL